MTGSSYYRWYVLGVLSVTYAFSFMDRQILSILLEDIRAEFALSDLQLGLLSGSADSYRNKEDSAYAET